MNRNLIKVKLILLASFALILFVDAFITHNIHRLVVMVVIAMWIIDVVFGLTKVKEHIPVKEDGFTHNDKMRIGLVLMAVPSAVIFIGLMISWIEPNFWTGIKLSVHVTFLGVITWLTGVYLVFSGAKKKGEIL